MLLNAAFMWNLFREKNCSISYKKYFSILRLSDIHLLVNVFVVAVLILYMGWISGNDERLFSEPASRDRAPSFNGMVMGRAAVESRPRFCCFGNCGSSETSQQPVNGLPVVQRV